MIELNATAAPLTVENFLGYVKSGHYDGTQFHRVIDGFMIQAGGYTTEFAEKPTRPPVKNEAEQASKAGMLNKPGTVAMARTSNPHSASAQFFINVADNAFLNFREADLAGLRLHGVRQGRRGHGRREPDRQVAQGRRRAVPDGRARPRASLIKSAKVVDAK